MSQLLREILELEAFYEGELNKTDKIYKSFYMGLIKGIKLAREILLEEMKKN